MKHLLLLATGLLLLSAMHAQSAITAAEAAKHLGEKATVCDKVFGARYLENAKDAPTLVNLGGAYPNNPFTFVIFADNRKKFSYQPEQFLLDKQVCVTGQISDYHGKPQIIVTDTTQLTVH